MSRNLSSAVTSISQLPQVKFRVLVEVFSLSTGTTRACSGADWLFLDGNTYAPIGNLGGIEKIQEDSEVFPRAVRMWFSAINTQSIQDVLNESMFMKPVLVKSTFLTDSYTNVASLETRFKGRINTCDLKLLDPERGDYFEIEAESRLAQPARARFFDRATLWTVYAQSGDTFFDFMHTIPFAKANWGSVGETTYYGPGGPPPFVPGGEFPDTQGPGPRPGGG